jgi:hypothetical protein
MKVNMEEEIHVWGFYSMTKPGADVSKKGSDKIDPSRGGYTKLEGIKLYIQDYSAGLLVKAATIITALYVFV